jgi:hypothetical protein
MKTQDCPDFRYKHNYLTPADNSQLQCQEAVREFAERVKLKLVNYGPLAGGNLIETAVTQALEDLEASSNADSQPHVQNETDELEHVQNQVEIAYDQQPQLEKVSSTDQALQQSQNELDEQILAALMESVPIPDELPSTIHFSYGPWRALIAAARIDELKLLKDGFSYKAGHGETTEFTASEIENWADKRLAQLKDQTHKEVE